jgi:hypothetical protein
MNPAEAQEQPPKRLELLKEIAPSVSRIASLGEDQKAKRGT